MGYPETVLATLALFTLLLAMVIVAVFGAIWHIVSMAVIGA